MMYRIKVSYETGDSFGREDTYDVLDMTWKNVEVAKANLVRIERHYKWAECDGPRPEFVGDSKTSFGEDLAKYYLYLLEDDGTEKQVCAGWVGYFETLYGAEIISDPEDGWSFRL